MSIIKQQESKPLLTVETPKIKRRRGRPSGYKPEEKLNKKTDNPRYFADKMIGYRAQKKKITYNCIEIAGIKYLWKNKLPIKKVDITKIKGNFLIVDL